MSDKKSAFLVTPIGEQNSPINISARGLIETIINPVLEEMNFEITNPMNDNSTGSITNQIMKHIVDDDLVVVNLTGINPNVMYELALRHSTDKPVVVLIRNDQISKVPFDIKDERLIIFNDSFYGVDELKQSVKKHVTEAMSGKGHSPIFNATKEISIVRGDNSEENIVSSMETMKVSIENLESQVKRLSNENVYSDSIMSDSVSRKIDTLNSAQLSGLVISSVADSIRNTAINGKDDMGA